jgi:hypothetical protein
MRITLINQAFHPDVVSSGQHLADLALHLAGRGHEVNGEPPCAWAEHGEVDRVVEHIVASKKRMVQPDEERGVPLAKGFSKEVLLPQLVATLEGVEG